MKKISLLGMSLFAVVAVLAFSIPNVLMGVLATLAALLSMALMLMALRTEPEEL